MSTLPELFKQRDDLRNRITQKRSEFEQATIPVTADDATRYLNERVGGFQPLLEERRNLMAQATQVMPSQIQQLIQARQGGQQTADPMTMLNSIFRNRSNIMGTADLIGDQVETARGRLGDIAGSALQQLGQKQSSMKDLLSMYDNDLNRIIGQIENEKARQEARRAAAANAALQQSLMDQQMSGLLGDDSIDAGTEDLPQDPDIIQNISQLGSRGARNNPLGQRIANHLRMQYGMAQNNLPERFRFVGNDKNFLQDIGSLFGR
jgi:hypothetical protein